MKMTLAMICALATLGMAAASAQAPDRMAQLARDLSLTDAQKPQFQQILDEERSNLTASMREERDQHTDVQIAHQNHQKIEDAAMAKLKPILSDQQFKKYQQIVAAEAYARHHRAAGSSAPAAP